jgi:hypothetical protein
VTKIEDEDEERTLGKVANKYSKKNNEKISKEG